MNIEIEIWMVYLSGRNKIRPRERERERENSEWKLEVAEEVADFLHMRDWLP